MYRYYYPVVTAEEAAAMIEDGQTVAFSGFTAAGAPKAVPLALAKRGKELHDKGEQFQIRALSGASTGALDDNLAESNVISWRAPYQSSRILRSQINKQQVRFTDLHLSHLPQMISFGLFGKIDVAVIEAVEITADGRVYLSTAIGASPTFLMYADKVIIEINRYHSVRLNEMADIHVLPPPPHRSPIPIYSPLGKIGLPYVAIDPKKVIGVVENDQPDGIAPLVEPAEVHHKIAEQVVNFLLKELHEGRIPKDFLPLQAGVGNVANAVMAVLGESSEIPPFYMYTEVLQDSLIDLMEDGKILGASTCSLTISDQTLKRVYEDMDYFAPRIVLRPQELSNNPGVIRRLGVISLNTALEADLTGHANSTHILGKDIVNGIGGSGDFTRNAYLSIFVCPSVAKGGRISTIVPMVTHGDNNEHSVQVLVTEQGLADLRGLDPMERTRRIINNCAHPAYRDYLWKYWKESPVGHIRQDLSRCFELHQNLVESGQMLPDLDLSQF
ncbi:MAG: succinate CoA transferase [Firmicutes bacterium]|nr:succinate CoA transferase [Bacillota bacterium]